MKNKKIYSSILVIVIIVGISIAGFVTVNYFKEEKLRSIAESICKDVGLVTSLNSGKTDKPIFIFDEIHNSIIGQIQNAIMLVRLYSQLNLRDIALEGYLLESEEIITDWYINASNGNNITKSKVAINLLKEGEISCAEFMKLVFDDIRLHRIEREVDYRIEVDSYAYSAPRLFLFKIASKDLNEKFRPVRTITF